MQLSKSSKLHCLVLVAFSFVIGNAAEAALMLHFDSAERSWVGQGQSFTVTPADDYLFTSYTSSFDESLHFQIASRNSPFGPDWDPGSGEEYHYWTLDLEAPFGLPLFVGRYENTARWPFQHASQPGLTFSGDHRGNNRNGGFFDVLEVSIDSAGTIERFAVDFTQYGEQRLDWWLTGQLRYNSTIEQAIPEPSSGLLLLVGLLSASFARRRRPV
jgi:hypothetical protein